MAELYDPETNVTMDVLSVELLNATLVANVYWLLFGFFAILNNLLLIISMKLSNREWNNFRINTSHLAFADLIVGVVQFAIGIKRLNLTALQLPETSTPARCSIDMGAVIFGLQVSVSQTFCLSTDRFMAVVFPIVYRNYWSFSRWSHVINYLLWVVSIIITVVGITAGTRTDALVPVCTMSGVFTPSFFQGFIFYLAFYVVVITAQYTAIVIVVRKRLQRARKTHLNVTTVKQEMETHVLGSLKYIVVVFVVTWLVASAAADCLALFAPLHYSRIIIPYLVGLTGLNGALNFPIYVWKLEDIRADFTRLFRKKSQVAASTFYHPNLQSSHTTSHRQTNNRFEHNSPKDTHINHLPQVYMGPCAYESESVPVTPRLIGHPVV